MPTPLMVSEPLMMQSHGRMFANVLLTKFVALARRNGCVKYCHATARGSIPGWNGVQTELHVLRMGQ